MLNIVSSEKLPPELLWQRLKVLQIFEGFTNEQRDSLLQAYEHKVGLRLHTFAPGEVICRKGEYKLDLCFILGGSVELFNELPDIGRTHVATLETGMFYGERGAIGGLPRTLDIVAREPTEIFYLPRHTLKYLQVNAQARTLLFDRYREMAVRATVAALELFRSVTPEFITELRHARDHAQAETAHAIEPPRAKQAAMAAFVHQHKNTQSEQADQQHRKGGDPAGNVDTQHGDPPKRRKGDQRRKNLPQSFNVISLGIPKNDGPLLFL